MIATWMKRWNVDVKKLRLWLVAIAGAAILAFAWDFTRAPESKLEPEDPSTAATYIPAGYVLVPIEVENYESLDSILGKFGVVDLFKTPLEGKGRPVKVAERVKILRAPLNPSHFAVLVPDSESSRLVAMPGAFTVVVQNPNRDVKGDGTRFVNSDREGRPRKVRGSRISVEVVNANP